MRSTLKPAASSLRVSLTSPVTGAAQTLDVYHVAQRVAYSGRVHHLLNKERLIARVAQADKNRLVGKCRRHQELLTGVTAAAVSE